MKRTNDQLQTISWSMPFYVAGLGGGPGSYEELQENTELKMLELLKTRVKPTPQGLTDVAKAALNLHDKICRRGGPMIATPLSRASYAAIKAVAEEILGRSTDMGFSDYSRTLVVSFFLKPTTKK